MCFCYLIGTIGHGNGKHRIKSFCSAYAWCCFLFRIIIIISFIIVLSKECNKGSLLTYNRLIVLKLLEKPNVLMLLLILRVKRLIKINLVKEIP